MIATIPDTLEQMRRMLEPEQVQQIIEFVYEDELAAARKERKRQLHASKRRGWRIARAGGMRCDCLDEVEEMGWAAYRMSQIEGANAADVADTRALATALGIVMKLRIAGES